jgi:disulfide bond formation protein DsbB
MKSQITFVQRVQKYGMRIIFWQALIATLWSLYYGFYGDPISNIFVYGIIFPSDNWFLICDLCRYARILMYPLTIISLYAIITKNFSFVGLIQIFWWLGIILELYHYILQKIPFKTSFACTAWNITPCAALQVNYLWFITIPFLCLIAFSIIFSVATILNRSRQL